MCSYNFSIYCIPHPLVQLAARAGSKCVFTSFPTCSISLTCVLRCFFQYMLAPNVYLQNIHFLTRSVVAWLTRFRCALLTQHVKLQLFHLLYPRPVCAIGSACWVKMCIHKFSYLLHFPHLCPVFFPLHAGFKWEPSVKAGHKFMN